MEFGYYLNTEVIEVYGYNVETDNKSFEFNLQSKYNRLKQPMKFEIKNLIKGGIYLWEKSTEHDLITLGDIYLRKENKKNESYCWQNESYFNYHGIEKALCGKTGRNNEFFSPKRILTIIQMAK